MFLAISVVLLYLEGAGDGNTLWQVLFSKFRETETGRTYELASDRAIARYRDHGTEELPHWAVDRHTNLFRRRMRQGRSDSQTSDLGEHLSGGGICCACTKSTGASMPRLVIPHSTILCERNYGHRRVGSRGHRPGFPATTARIDDLVCQVGRSVRAMAGVAWEREMRSSKPRVALGEEDNYVRGDRRRSRTWG